MGHEVKIEKSDSELSAKFRSTIVKGLEDLLKSAQELDLDKIENVKYITDASHDVTETITSRHRLMFQIKREAATLTEIEESQKGRTNKRDTKSLVAATGTTEKSQPIMETLKDDPRLKFIDHDLSGTIRYSQTDEEWKLQDRILTHIGTDHEIYDYIQNIDGLDNTNGWVLLSFDNVQYIVRNQNKTFLTVLEAPVANESA